MNSVQRYTRTFKIIQAREAMTAKQLDLGAGIIADPRSMLGKSSIPPSLMVRAQ